MFTEYLGAVLPALVAAVPVLLLTMELRQRNTIERKKIEVEYLKAAIEALELPLSALHQLEVSSNFIALRRKSGITVDVESETSAGATTFVEALAKHKVVLSRAQIFAKAGGADALVNALDGALRAAESLRPLAAIASASAVKSDMRPLSIYGEPTGVVDADLSARRMAAEALAFRIHELYG